jgi:hypothetical protein
MSGVTELKKLAKAAGLKGYSRMKKQELQAALGAAPVPIRVAKARVARTQRGCTVQTTKKYATRPSPAMPANNCCGVTATGNDGNVWKSVANANGVCRWVMVGQTGGWSW